MEDRIAALTKLNMLDACEFVRFDEDKITIAVDREIVNDEAIDHALQLFLQMDTFEPGTLKQF